MYFSIKSEMIYQLVLINIAAVSIKYTSLSDENSFQLHVHFLLKKELIRVLIIIFIITF